MSRREPISLDGSGWTVKGYLDDDWRMRRAYAPRSRGRAGRYRTLFPGEEQTLDVGWTAAAADHDKLAVGSWNAEVTVHV